MNEGEVIDFGGELGEVKIGALLAYQGKRGCTNPLCRRGFQGECAGYHCPICHEPCSMYGHEECRNGS